MKITLKKFPVAFAALAVLWLGSDTSWAIPPVTTLTVTPAVTSNTYGGIITLGITGLTNGEKVIILKYLDGNANGSADLGEPLMDFFKITDGGVMAINGVTNINVPFDRNVTNGVITTTLNFAPPLPLDNIVGQHLYQLVSPTGRFTPVSATLLVTNATTGQTLSGTVYSNGLAPLPYAVIVVMPPNGNGYTGATVADSGGNYRINVAPGSYGLLAAAPNYFTDEAIAPQVTVTNGMSATNNLYLTNGTVTISGAIYDAANSNGLGGQMFQLESGSLFGVGFTDTSGNFSAAVSPGFWKLKPNKERLPRRAYVVSPTTFQVNTTAGNVTNANLALDKGNALFYGRITDNTGAPLPNVEFSAGATNNQSETKGYSDPDGYYAVAVLGDPNLAGTTNIYYSSPNTGANAALASYILNTYDSVNVLSNQTILQNFTALPVNSRISGHVQDSHGNPVVDVKLYAYASAGGTNYQSLSIATDNSGDYALGVSHGTWQVNFIVGSTHDLANQGLVDLFQPYLVTLPPTNAMLNLTVYPAGTPRIAGATRTSSTQFVFNVVGSSNVNYTVQVSTNLATTNWGNLLSFQLTSNYFPVVDSQATNSRRYYRLLKN